MYDNITRLMVELEQEGVPALVMVDCVDNTFYAKLVDFETHTILLDPREGNYNLSVSGTTVADVMEGLNMMCSY